MPPDSPRLNRSISLTQATAMVVGTIIGASIFVQPSLISDAVPTPGGIYLVWAIAGVLTLFGSLICAELSSAFPRSGGVYVFLREAWSPAVGFLWGWAMFWTMHTGIVAAVAMIFARYVGHFAPMGDWGVRLVAILGIAVLSAVNYVGVRQGSRLQTAFTIGKVVAILIVVVAGFALGPRDSAAVGAGAVAAGGVSTPGEMVTIRDYLLALVAGLFAFGGWHMVTYAADETVDPERTIPRALIVGTLLVTACYIALNAVYLHVLPLERVISSNRVAADAADAVLGRGGATLMAALVIFSTFGALSGIILSGPRVYLSMARDGLLFRWLAAIHPAYGTPHRAIVLQGVWAAVLVATGSYRALFTRVVYTEWIFFALMAAGLFALRRRHGYTPRYTVWGFPLVPVVFIVMSLAIVINQIASQPLESLTGLALVAVGWPVYRLWVRREERVAVGV